MGLNFFRSSQLLGDALGDIAEINAAEQAQSDILANTAEKVAREGLKGIAASLEPDKWDFSAFYQDFRAEDFTHRQLFMASFENTLKYNSKQLDNDQFMDSSAEGNFDQNQLRLLAFSIKNKADYNARINRLSFGDDALILDYESRIIRVKIKHSMPHIIANPISCDNMIDVSEYITQDLKTEGGLDHYKVFMSLDYQVDALQILTPDVLAVMIEYGPDFAYKIYDNELEIHMPRSVMSSFDFIRDALMEAVYLARELDHQSGNYRDFRASPYAKQRRNIAPSGRRMAYKLEPWKILVPLVLLVIAIALKMASVDIVDAMIFISSFVVVTIAYLLARK